MNIHKIAVIAGTGKANPLATVWSASQMLDFFGYTDWGKKLIECIEEVLVEKKVLTPDLGGSATTAEVGDEIVKNFLKKIVIPNGIKFKGSSLQN